MSLFVFDAWRLDTTPGAPSQTFSPPRGWEGDSVDYLNWLRSQYKSNHCFRQRLGSAARSLRLDRIVMIEGPYRDALISAFNSFSEKKSRTVS